MALAIIGSGVLIGLLIPKEGSDSDRGQNHTLPNGNILNLTDVTFGRRHDFDAGHVSAALPLFSSRRVTTRSTREEAMMLWFRCKNEDTGEPEYFDWWLISATEDSHGCRFFDDDPSLFAFGSRSSSSSSGSRPMPDPRKQGARGAGNTHDLVFASSTLPRFPRRQASFPLTVFDLELDAAATFTVTNPVVQPFPEWTPDSLPAIRAIGNETAVLEEVRVRVSSDRDRHLEFQRIRLDPVLRFQRNGKTIDDWTWKDRVVADATGNVAELWDVRLCPFEAAWKLKLRMYRRSAAEFEENQVHTTEPFSFPGRDMTTALDWTGLASGVAVRFWQMAGAGKTAFQLAPTGDRRFHSMSTSGSGYTISMDKGNEYEVTSESPFLVATLNSFDENLHLTVEAIDRDGRRFGMETRTLQDHHFWFLSGEENEPPPVPPFRVRMIIQRLRDLEFLIAPPAIAREIMTSTAYPRLKVSGQSP